MREEKMFDEYLELKRQCKLKNIDFENYINYRIMTAVEEIAYKQPIKNEAQLKAENEYFRDKAVNTELALNNARQEGWTQGYDMGTRWSEKHES